MNKNDDKKNSGRGFVISVLFGTAIGFFLILVIFAIFAAFIASGKVSEGAMLYIAVFASFIGGMTGAVAAAKRHRAKIMTVGLTVGALMFFITLAGALLSEGAFGGRLTPAFLIAFLAGGITGGLLSLKKKKHKHA
jgi:putative membrane protein (TIGR04086 family)